MKTFYCRLLCVFLVVLSFSSSAQKASIAIKVVDSRQVLVPFATVTISKQQDSTQTLSAIADTVASVAFDLDTPGLYIVRITALNYKPASKVILIKDNMLTFTITMEPGGNALEEVTIQEVKPLMRQEDDKTIIDPEALAAASTSGYEVLEKTPGIFVDQDGNIYLNSTTPATIYINGREMKMSRNDIATMLKSLPPNAIEKIEIMRTPSAKYDATGSGGVVNVVLRKGIKIGLTGSVNAGLQQGRYGNQFGNLNLSNNNGATSTYINLSYARSNDYDVLNTTREIGADTVLNQQARTTKPGNAYFAGFGINHDWNDKWNASYDSRLSYSNSDNKTRNTNIFSVQSNDQELGRSIADLTNENNSFLLNQDLATTYKIDTAGSEWTSSFSYTYSSGNIDQFFNTQSLIPYGGDGQVHNKRHFISGQTDLAYKFPYRISLETGLKATYLSFNNGSAYFLSYNGIRQPDGSRTSTYRYTENINSAYLQASKKISDFIVKAGLRMENTNMAGRQRIPDDTAFDIRRTDFFPYIYLSKKVMTIAKFELRAYLVYRRTISRPTYEQLNPFPRYIDQFLSEAGNPTLRPQFTNNYEINVSADEHPLLAIGLNDTKDMFTNVYYQADSSRVQAYRTFDNIGKNREFYLRGFGAIPPGGKYFFVFGGQYNYNIYEGLYEGKPLSFRQGGFLFFTYHQLKIDKNSQITLHGFLRLKGPLQFYELSTFGALNININRKFFKQKLTVTLSANDIFFTRNNEFKIMQGSVNASGYRESDSRRFGINLRYNFGFHKKEEEKDMFNIPERTN